MMYKKSGQKWIKVDSSNCEKNVQDNITNFMESCIQ